MTPPNISLLGWKHIQIETGLSDSRCLTPAIEVSFDQG